MPRNIAVLFLGLIVPPSVADDPEEFPTDLGRWIVVEAPRRDSDAWSVANDDFHHTWAVSIRDGKPRVELAEEWPTPAPLPFEIEPGDGLYGRRYATRVSDGWIVGFNKGEFGGWLWWFSSDGKSRERIAKDVRTRAFVETKQGLLVVEGLAHGLRSRGRILRLARNPEGRWKAEDVIDLKDAPEAVVKTADGSLLVATHGRLLKVDPASRKVNVLLDEAFWASLYPDSMVVAPDGRIYIGMRHGVARVEKGEAGHKVAWLLPNRAFVEEKPKEGFR